MSMKSAKEFIQRLKNDDEFLKRVRECKDVEERTALVKAEGFEFTRDEINNLKDTLTDADVRGTIFQESRLGYDGPLGHGWVK